MKKYVKFTGKFTELVPNGWKFGKAFARQYRYYSKACAAHSDENFRIWQHLGGYVEYEDWYSNSWVIFDLVQSGKYLEGIWKIPSCNYYRFSVNRETGEVEKHIDPCFFFYNHVDNLKLIQDYRAKFKELIFNDEEVNFIKDIISRGWIEIREEDRKKS